MLPLTQQRPLATRLHHALATWLRPDLAYTGLDVGDYSQQDSIRYAEAYMVVPPTEFADAIAAHAGQMDAVVSSHNLEHCDNPAAATAAEHAGRFHLGANGFETIIWGAAAATAV